MRFFGFATRRADAMEASAIARYERRRELSAVVARAARAADAIARLEAALRSNQTGPTQSRSRKLTPVPVAIPIDDRSSFRRGQTGRR